MKSRTFSQLPSSVFGEHNALAAWMLDNAVMWFGLTIENALQERVKVTVGNETQYNPKYTLARLLNPDFKLIRPVEQEVSQNPWAPFLAWLGKPRSGVRKWVYKAPEPDQEEKKE